MKFGIVPLAIALVMTSYNARATEIEVKAGDKTIILNVNPATNGDGYSIYSKEKGGAKPACYNVTLNCGDGSSDSACCPTVYYDTRCPNAKITCK